MVQEEEWKSPFLLTRPLSAAATKRMSVDSGFAVAKALAYFKPNKAETPTNR